MSHNGLSAPERCPFRCPTVRPRRARRPTEPHPLMRTQGRAQPLPAPPSAGAPPPLGAELDLLFVEPAEQVPGVGKLLREVTSNCIRENYRARSHRARWSPTHECALSGCQHFGIVLGWEQVAIAIGRHGKRAVAHAELHRL